MNREQSPTGHDCESIQELIVWQPVAALDAAEQRRVTAHANGCSDCQELLRFATLFRERLQEQFSYHPDPDLLSCFCESPASLAADQRQNVEEHLAACSDCRDLVDILKAVERDDGEVATPSTPTATVPRRPTAEMAVFPGFWESLRRNLFGPVPALVYLLAALVFTGLYVFQPDRSTEGRSESGFIPGVLGGVVIVPDETGRSRQAGPNDTELTGFAHNESQFLLLEMTGLTTPPGAEAIYMVEITGEGATAPVYRTEVLGSAFLENYTLCLALEAGRLAPGVYLIEVLDPAVEAVFRSRIEAW